MTRNNDEMNNILEYLSVNDQGFNCYGKADKMDSLPVENMLVSTYIIVSQSI